MTRTLFFLIAVAVAAIVLVYPPLRILVWLETGMSGAALTSIGSLSFGLPFFLRYLAEYIHNEPTRIACAIGMTWLGVCFVGLSIVLPLELLRPVMGVEDRTAGAIAMVYVLAIGAYAIVNALRFHVHDLLINAPTPARGITLAQISDVHIGSRRPHLLERIVTQTNALNPDYVLITGDLIDMRNISEEALLPLRDLQAPTLFCTGNHERYVDLEAICRRLGNLGVEVLRNRSLTPALNQAIQFIGIDDAESKRQVADKIVDIRPEEDRFRVLLYHRPDGMQAAADWGAHLMLTGHTHRGQILPFNLLVNRVFPQSYRDYRVGDMTLYVSPGTGTWGPVMRFGSKCEITRIRLV